MYKQLLGEVHPNVATLQWNFGGLYQLQGSYYLAEMFYIQALAIAQSTLGPNHPTTKGIQNSLNSLPTNA
ncbi:MAG: tetratricopeptide repeat protein [Phormidesmis sp.]